MSTATPEGVLSLHTLPKGSTMSTVYIAPAGTPAPGRLVGDHIDLPVDWRPVGNMSFDDLIAGPSSELVVEPLNPDAPFGPVGSHYRASLVLRTLETSPDLLRLLMGKPPRLRTRVLRALRRYLSLRTPHRPDYRKATA